MLHITEGYSHPSIYNIRNNFETTEIHVLTKMSLNNLGDDNVMTVWWQKT